MAERRKLIEVALPLEAINRESAHEKSVPRKGHPATLHLWWARRPLAACRAVLFAQLVDDPSSQPDEFPTEEDQDRERERLFGIIERLAKWENSTDQHVLEEARAEIRRSCGEVLPRVLDPFAGGGSIPLEAQRLGLEAHARDLNPVAVLINKALVEIPAAWSDRAPVRPDDGDTLDVRQGWSAAKGLEEDVRWAGKRVEERLEDELGDMYPEAILDDGSSATVIAWLWARTVTCPNPACRSTMPLVRSFWLSKKKGRKAWIKPSPRPSEKRVEFSVVKDDEGPPIERTVQRTGATCLNCDAAVPLDYIREQGRVGQMDAQLMAVVAEGNRRREYVSPTEVHEKAAAISRPANLPDPEVPTRAHDVDRLPMYGMYRWTDAFTNRQACTLSVLTQLIAEVRDEIRELATGTDLERERYAAAIATYLAFAVSKLADWSSSLCSWIPRIEGVRDSFARQALPMVWDYVEINPLSNSVGNLGNHIDWVASCIGELPGSPPGFASQGDVLNPTTEEEGYVIATDPPYYDNISYANLSDYFYVWLRESLAPSYPDLLATVLTPKSSELIADPVRHDGEEEEFFRRGFRRAFSNLSRIQAVDYPLTFFYAFKQTESASKEGAVSTGWETMLDALLRDDLAVTATWPIRTERAGRLRDIDSNALASSIVLACRPRAVDAGITDRQGFLRSLYTALPGALRDMQKGNVAPVDLAQAAIGPGMAVFSSYAKVVEPSGERMTVRSALGLINQVLDQVLAEHEGEFDAETRWAIKWFEQFGFDEGPFGVAETLFTATATSFDGLRASGVLDGRAGKVWLVARNDMSADWDPAEDDRVPVWEVTMQLIKRLEEQGEEAAAELLARVGHLGDVARDLAYRLYNICERKKWANEALAFNSLVSAWPELQRKAADQPSQTTMNV